jgi:hypothetical protein
MTQSLDRTGSLPRRQRLFSIPEGPHDHADQQAARRARLPAVRLYPPSETIRRGTDDLLAALGVVA